MRRSRRSDGRGRNGLGCSQGMVSMTPAQPALDAMMEGVTALQKAVRDGWEHAGTLPAKSAVKVRPEDWHRIRYCADDLAAARELVPALAAEARAQRETIAGLTARVEKLTEALTLIERLYYIEDKDTEWRASRMNGVAREAQDGNDLGHYRRIFPRQAISGEAPND
jgi:hypothetical protein